MSEKEIQREANLSGYLVEGAGQATLIRVYMQRERGGWGVGGAEGERGGRGGCVAECSQQAGAGGRVEDSSLMKSESLQRIRVAESTNTSESLLTQPA